MFAVAYDFFFLHSLHSLVQKKKIILPMSNDLIMSPRKLTLTPQKASKPSLMIKPWPKRINTRTVQSNLPAKQFQPWWDNQTPTWMKESCPNQMNPKNKLVNLGLNKCTLAKWSTQALDQTERTLKSCFPNKIFIQTTDPWLKWAVVHQWFLPWSLSARLNKGFHPGP